MPQIPWKVRSLAPRTPPPFILQWLIIIPPWTQYSGLCLLRHFPQRFLHLQLEGTHLSSFSLCHCPLSLLRHPLNQIGFSPTSRPRSCSFLKPHDYSEVHNYNWHHCPYILLSGGAPLSAVSTAREFPVVDSYIRSSGNYCAPSIHDVIHCGQWI